MHCQVSPQGAARGWENVDFPTLRRTEVVRPALERQCVASQGRRTWQCIATSLAFKARRRPRRPRSQGLPPSEVRVCSP